MTTVQISDWRRFRRDGQQYLKTAVNARRKRTKVFSPAILYNLTCMAIEKLVMAFLMKHGDLADNHTMGDLFSSLERHLKNMPGLAERFSYLDRFQEICDLDEYLITIPGEQEIDTILKIGSDVEHMLHPYLMDERYTAY